MQLKMHFYPVENLSRGELLPFQQTEIYLIKRKDRPQNLRAVLSLNCQVLGLRYCCVNIDCKQYY